MEDKRTIIIVSKYNYCRNSVANAIIGEKRHEEKDVIFKTRSIVVDRAKLDNSDIDIVMLPGNMKEISDYCCELAIGSVAVIVVVVIKIERLFSCDSDICKVIKQIIPGIPGIKVLVAAVSDNEREALKWLESSREYVMTKMEDSGNQNQRKWKSGSVHASACATSSFVCF